MLAMVEAAARGLRTYTMFCPLLPGITDSEEDIHRLIKFAVDCQVEGIFVEPVNPRDLPNERDSTQALGIRCSIRLSYGRSMRQVTAL